MRSRILVADDHDLVRKGMRLLLETASDFEVCEAENGQEAVDKTKELKPDLVILDISMPVMDGLSAAREIRTIAPDTPILIFSLNRTEVFRDVAERIGVTGYVTKSEGAETLMMAVHAALKSD